MAEEVSPSSDQLKKDSDGRLWPRIVVADFLGHSKVIVRVKKRDGFVVYLPAGAEQGRAETNVSGNQKLGRNIQVKRLEVDCPRVNEKLRVDFQPDLDGEGEEIHCRGWEWARHCRNRPPARCEGHFEA